MKSVKTQPRFQCDFCKQRSTKSTMEKHERRCFRNPNRFCDNCENTGKVLRNILTTSWEQGQEVYERRPIDEPCTYCAQFDRQQLADIEAYEHE